MRKRNENVYKKAPAATGAYDTYVVCTKDTYMLARDVSLVHTTYVSYAPVAAGAFLYTFSFLFLIYVSSFLN